MIRLFILVYLKSKSIRHVSHGLYMVLGACYFYNVSYITYYNATVIIYHVGLLFTCRGSREMVSEHLI